MTSNDAPMGGTSGRAGRPVVLVVDEDERSRRIERTVLVDGGFAVVEATNAHEALELLSQRRFAAVLLDLNVSGMAGVELIKTMRTDSAASTVPIIVVTSDNTLADRVRGLGAGATDFVSKPFNGQELAARVAAQVRWQASWMRLMEVQLRERSDLETALWRLNPEATPELTAELVCEQLRRVRGITAAAILVFTDAGQAIPLSVHDLPLWSMAVGRPLSADLTAYLKEQAVSGPWVERREHRAVRAASGDPTDSPGMVACAPLLRGHDLLGLLVLTTDVPGSDSRAGGRFRAISAAIDFADIASGLLGPGLDEQARKLTQRALMDNVLRTKAFRPVFQPIVRLSDGKVIGFEALTRFSDGTGPEARFLEAAAVNRRLELERVTLEAALEASSAFPSDWFISLNVSPDLVLEQVSLRELLTRVDRPIVLELTEHDPVEDYAALRGALARLGDVGEVQLSIDDAGSGFASLKHVLALEPSYVKLDHSWVTGLDADPTRQALIAGLAHFATTTGCHLIAEGIETVLDLDALRGLDVELGQGFLFGQPSPTPSDDVPVVIGRS